MQELDFEWFISNYDSLYKQYGNSFLAIKDKTVLGSYKTYYDGVMQTLKTEKIGSFIVQQCSDNKVSATNSFVASINY